jgi:hypothetical protein
MFPILQTLGKVLGLHKQSIKNGEDEMGFAALVRDSEMYMTFRLTGCGG